MRFIGREQELRKLGKLIEDDRMGLALIYGRRRVGKSELIKRALSDSKAKAIYYECKEVSGENNARSLAGLASSALGLPRLGYGDMESLLRYLFELGEKEKMVLVLDEYPYLRKAVEGMDSILQSLVDEFRERSKLTLVILGSYVETMRSLLRGSSPLYGRVDLAVALKEMDYYESSLFYPGLSNEDKIRIYSVFGGIPYYNRLIDDSKSARENIIALIASDGARLENEVSMRLSSEIAKIGNANEVFEAIAAGYSKYSDILSQSHVSSGPTLVDVLDKLIGMEVVEKVSPINDPANRRKAQYQISDALSLFYFRYVFPNSSQMRINDPDVFYESFIEKDFESSYVPHQFERVCTQYLVRQNKERKIDPPLELIGKYYYDDPKTRTKGEFDVVSKDARGYVFYEAKFKGRPVDEKTILEEIAQVKKTGLDCYKYVFFSKSGFSCPSMDNVITIGLDELYK